MDERAFYTEKEETRKVKLVCPSCRGEFEAPVRWKVCRKGKNCHARGRRRPQKICQSTSYMVRLDDLVACYKCRKRFELTGQSTVLINDALGDPSVDPEISGIAEAVPDAAPNGLQISDTYQRRLRSIDETSTRFPLTAFNQMHGDTRGAAIFEGDGGVLHLA